MGDIFVRYIQLPPSVHGFTILDNDSNYNIYLNSTFSCENNQKTLEHELDHIKNNDFCSLDNIRCIEK